MGFGVWGLGFGVWGLGFGIWGCGLGIVDQPTRPRKEYTTGTHEARIIQINAQIEKFLGLQFCATPRGS